GRNAMAGPTYYSDLYADGGGLPSYYDGKTIIYEWMRGWMMAVTLFEDGSFNKMEPFASDIELNNLMDVELGPDGRMYLLEYGSGWFTQNDDSGLSYVEFNGGNRPPVIDNLIVNSDTGKLPLSVTAKVEANDLEGDALSYTWDLGNGETKETSEPEVTYSYSDAGEYKISVDVKDDKGEGAKSEVLTVVAGNSRPEISIDLSGGNSSFFIAGTPINYKVSVTDPDGNEDIDPNNIFVSVDYLEGMDEANKSLGHQQVSAAVTGKALTQGMDCKTCHKENGKSIGPSYLEVAEKYKNDRRALRYLQKKIVEGGSGVWGDVAMAAHPNITASESRQIALYIRSLAADEAKQKSLPAEGSIVPKPSPTDNVMVLTASYTDKGIGGVRPLTGVSSVNLRGSTVPFTGNEKTQDFMGVEFGGMKLLVLPTKEGWFVLEDIDLKGVKTATLIVGFQELPDFPVDFELRLDAPDGKVIGKGSMLPKANQVPGGFLTGMIPIALDGPMDDIKAKELYFVHKPDTSKPRGEGFVAVTNVNFGS
ncbi:MAG: PKD domain-containing protein, partial [Aurantibacter sp.]